MTYYRSPTKRLASAHAALAALGTYAAMATVVAVGAVVLLATTPKPAPNVAQFATADARSAMVKCGAYDVFMVGHDLESASDAREAARHYMFEKGCGEYARGLS